MKIHADEVHSVGSPPSAVRVQKPHIEASTPVRTADNSHARDISMHPEPIPSPHMFDVPHPSTTPSTKAQAKHKICRQYEPTAWCSNLTVRETKDKFRICLDPSNTINKAIRVPSIQFPALRTSCHICRGPSVSQLQMRYLASPTYS